MHRFTLSWGNFRIELGHRTTVMGILNVTPDSFSDGGRFYGLDQALAQAEKLVADGADILDVGGESTRPYSDPVAAEEEIRRVVPVIERIAPRIPVPVSIDTTKAEVAKAALDGGAAMVNDISALRIDPDLGLLVAERKVPLVLMHMLGRPKTMQAAPHYDRLLPEVIDFLEQAIARAMQYGIARSNLIIDPGIGFGKTFDHNLAIIAELDRLAALELPILIGPSRKAFIRHMLTDSHAEEPAPDAPLVETGTQAVVAAAILHGAHIVRVHDVANTAATATMVDAIRGKSVDRTGLV